GSPWSGVSDAVVVDRTAPQTTIDTAPDALSSNASPRIAFSASEDDASFECKLDDGDWSSCKSPDDLTDLGDGEHTFAVRAAGRPVQFSVDGACSLADGKVKTTGAGTCTVTASQVDDLPGQASPVTRTVAVAKRPLTVTGAQQSRTYGDDNPELVGTIGDG